MAPMRTTAVVLAGGTGQRVGLALPKQFVKIAGRSVLEHTLGIFEEASGVDDVLLMMAPGYVTRAEEIVVKKRLTKVVCVLEGGATRNDTTERAIAFLTARLPEGADQKVLFHDAVRPLLSQRIVADCIAALDTHDAVDVAIPTADTIIVTRTHGADGEYITDIPDRSRLRRGQTPQAFRLSTIRRAYRIAAADPSFRATDDCSVVLNYLPDVPIHVVRGDAHNMKVTEPVDIHIADKLFQLSSHTVPPQSGEDAYRRLLAGKALVVFGGSYGIGADIAALAEGYGATVFAHGRSTTGVHVENAEQVEKALAEAYAVAGRIDYVVNTAAVLRTGRLNECSDASIREALEVNYLAPVQIAKAAHRYLAASRGHLLLYTSSSYTRGRSEYSLYSSSKAAMVNLTQALADEWAADGVRVNCVNPERTRTPMRVRAFGEEPADSLLTSDAVARTSIDVLLSSRTGQVVDVRLESPAGSAAR
ncbi:bifunctional cytidylyltransferase/SDR family oxidoreductase [Streptomyces sp. NPDC002896]|uniref:bifunctional cytidylyltransferase/SDR family oxidoreductase n=1 Tax=Streptomyces sp. NPDC002896 TaxID=3154438 RepID=UPI0033340E82